MAPEEHHEASGVSAAAEKVSVAEEDSLLYSARRARSFAGGPRASGRGAGATTAAETLAPTSTLSQPALGPPFVSRSGLPQSALDALAVTDDDPRDSSNVETLSGELESHLSAIAAVAADLVPRVELAQSICTGTRCNVQADTTTSCEPDIC